MKNLIKNLGHESLWVRTGYAFMFFLYLPSSCLRFRLSFPARRHHEGAALALAYGVRRERIYPFFLH